MEIRPYGQLPRYRDSRRAVEVATEACELTEWSHPIYLETLADACAADGDFGAAVHSQAKANELAALETTKATGKRRLKEFEARRSQQGDELLHR